MNYIFIPFLSLGACKQTCLLLYTTHHAPFMFWFKAKFECRSFLFQEHSASVTINLPFFIHIRL